MKRVRMNFKKAFGKTLKTLRKEKGWTQEAAESHTGVAYRFLQDMEAGLSQPTIETVFKLAKGMKLKPADLLDTAWKEWLKSQKD